MTTKFERFEQQVDTNHFYLTKDLDQSKMEDSIETQLADDISGNIMLERDFKCLRQIGKLNLNKIYTTTEESH